MSLLAATAVASSLDLRDLRRFEAVLEEVELLAEELDEEEEEEEELEEAEEDCELAAVLWWWWWWWWAEEEEGRPDSSKSALAEVLSEVADVVLAFSLTALLADWAAKMREERRMEAVEMLVLVVFWPKRGLDTAGR